MDNISFVPIGVVHSPFSEPKGTPIQPAAAKDVEGRVEIYAEFAEGLKDLEGFSHVYLIYHFHRSRRFSLTVTPFLDDTDRGVFATRAPARPNPIGLSIVRLVAVRGNILAIKDVDIVDGTPLLDVKPYVPAFDVITVERIGWLKGREKEVRHRKADSRFT
jgi:tRNA-Thr(GGU) m(6)t(6)A37 methyltransferase TsaA